MTWEVEIYAIDVGVGDSTLIVVEDSNASRLSSLLVDGGLDGAARFVHAKVIANVHELDGILISHFDADHSMGILMLLIADNFWHLCDTITQVAVPVLPAGTRRQIIARAAARAAAAAAGAWGNYAADADQPGNDAAQGVPAAADDAQAADFGVRQAAPVYPGYKLIPPAQTRNKAARLAGVAAADSAGSIPAARDAVRAALMHALRTSIPDGARFDTGGIYGATRLIDIGDVVQPDQRYASSVSGGVVISSYKVQAPGVHRDEISIPVLGGDVLWRSRPPSDDAPVAIVVSTPSDRDASPTGTGWQGTDPPVPPVRFQGGTTGNCVSIGIVLVMEDFAFFTAGDLPSTGENPIGTALLSKRLPDGSGGVFAQSLQQIVNLKCSHHGASESTSGQFVATIKPTTAMISCGGLHGHPTQRVITTLVNQVALSFLTNCRVQRTGVPVSNGMSQLAAAGVKVLVSGDNNPQNDAPGRNRGDISLAVTEAQAAGAAGTRKYNVTYWEQQLMPPGPRTWTVSW